MLKRDRRFEKMDFNAFFDNLEVSIVKIFDAEFKLSPQKNKITYDETAF